LISVAGNLSDGHNWTDGCLGGTPGRAFNAPNTQVTLTGNSTFCQGGSASLSAYNDPDYTYQWLNNNQPIPGETNSTLIATDPGVYNVSVIWQGCSILSPSIVMTVIPQPADPVVQDATVCNSGSATLTATSNTTINWYTSSAGGVPVSIGPTFVTPVLTQPAVYYVAAGTNCLSQIIPVNVDVHPSPSLNIGNDTIVNSGSFVSLDAGSGFASYLWSDGSTTQSNQVISPANISIPTGIIAMNENQGFVFYPNPVHDKLNFVLSNDQSVVVELLDVDGRVLERVKKDFRDRTEGEMDVSRYAKGIYVLSVLSQQERKQYLIHIF
jgi:hypothetical protein